MRSVIGALAFASGLFVSVYVGSFTGDIEYPDADTSVVDSYVPIVESPFAPLRGDDNGDGVVDEDESGWDCATMGNQVCGSED